VTCKATRPEKTDPEVVFPRADGTLESAELNLRRLREFAMGDDTAAMLLSGMKGFSGLCTRNGKKFQFILGAALSCWLMGKKVDIRLSTNGDYPLLASSLNSVLRRMVEYGHQMSDDVHWYKFLSADNKPLAMSQALRALFTDAHREDAVAIWWYAATLPTSQTKGQVVDYDYLSKNLIPPQVQGEFIAYTPIYGIQMFGSDDQALRLRSNKTESKKETIRKDVLVYEFSNACGFCGVISNIKDLCLGGIGYPIQTTTATTTLNVVESVSTTNSSATLSHTSIPAKKVVTNRYDFTGDEGLVRVPLKRINTEKEWYSKVAMDCRYVILGLFRPTVRYSPISNLVSLSKKGLELQRTVLDDDELMYVPQAISRARLVRGERIDEDFGDDEGSGDELEGENDGEDPPMRQQQFVVGTPVRESVEDEGGDDGEEEPMREGQLRVESGDEKFDVSQLNPNDI